MIAINVLSLCDGIACARVALERAGIAIARYYASEINQHAIAIAHSNYPDIIQLGCITQVDANQLPQIDLIMAGTPCQGFSRAGSSLNFEDPRSRLYFDFEKILKAIQARNPKVIFLLENVVMAESALTVITERLGVEPILINSALVSAQNRQRLYWTNIPNVQQPEDRQIYLRDILEYNIDSDKIGIRLKSRCVRVGGRNSPIDSRHCWDSPFIKCDRKLQRQNDIDITRRYTVTECERLQTLPDYYTQKTSVAKSHQYTALGNGWTVDVIAHLLSYLKPEFFNANGHNSRGAYRTHFIRRTQTELRIKTAIKEYQTQHPGKRITKSAIAKMVGIRREELSRSYKHLFHCDT